MNERKKICVIGGDMRQKYAADALADAGFDVFSYGIIPECDLQDQSFPSDRIKNSDLILLPLPFSTDGIRLSCPISKYDIRLEKLCQTFRKRQVIAGGKLTSEFEEKLKNIGCIPLDYYRSIHMNILNAIPSAEGAIAIAVQETEITLFGSVCGITGYGKIGKTLAKRLLALGAEVYVFARSEEALSWAEADGCSAYPINNIAENIGNLDIIFNTVPAEVITQKALENTKESVVLIDLASAPGGIDREAASRLSKRIVYALSLPGKYSPKSAGKYVADCIINMLRGKII